MPRHPCVARSISAYPVEVTWCHRHNKKYPLRKETVFICRPKKDNIALLLQCRESFSSDDEMIVEAKQLSETPNIFHCEMEEQIYFNNSTRKEKEITL